MEEYSELKSARLLYPTIYRIDRALDVLGYHPEKLLEICGITGICIWRSIC